MNSAEIAAQDERSATAALDFSGGTLYAELTAGASVRLEFTEGGVYKVRLTGAADGDVVWLKRGDATVTLAADPSEGALELGTCALVAGESERIALRGDLYVACRLITGSTSTVYLVADRVA